MFLRGFETSLNSVPGQVRIVVTAANHVVSGCYLKVKDVPFVSSGSIGGLMEKLFSIPSLPAPFGQQIIGKVAGISVLFRLEFICFFEKRACISHGPALIYGYHLHGHVPFRAFAGQLRGFLENSLGFRCALPKELPPALAYGIGITSASRIRGITEVNQSRSNARGDGFWTGLYPALEQ